MIKTISIITLLLFVTAQAEPALAMRSEQFVEAEPAQKVTARAEGDTALEKKETLFALPGTASLGTADKISNIASQFPEYDPDGTKIVIWCEKVLRQFTYADFKDFVLFCQQNGAPFYDAEGKLWQELSVLGLLEKIFFWDDGQQAFGLRWDKKTVKQIAYYHNAFRYNLFMRRHWGPRRRWRLGEKAEGYFSPELIDYINHFVVDRKLTNKLKDFKNQIIEVGSIEEVAQRYRRDFAEFTYYRIKNFAVDKIDEQLNLLLSANHMRFEIFYIEKPKPIRGLYIKRGDEMSEYLGCPYIIEAYREQYPDITASFLVNISSALPTAEFVIPHQGFFVSLRNGKFKAVRRTFYFNRPHQFVEFGDRGRKKALAGDQYNQLPFNLTEQLELVKVVHVESTESYSRRKQAVSDYELSVTDLITRDSKVIKLEFMDSEDNWFEWRQDLKFSDLLRQAEGAIGAGVASAPGAVVEEDVVLKNARQFLWQFDWYFVGPEGERSLETAEQIFQGWCQKYTIRSRFVPKSFEWLYSVDLDIRLRNIALTERFLEEKIKFYLHQYNRFGFTIEDYRVLFGKLDVGPFFGEDTFLLWSNVFMPEEKDSFVKYGLETENIQFPQGLPVMFVNFFSRESSIVWGKDSPKRYKEKLAKEFPAIVVAHEVAHWFFVPIEKSLNIQLLQEVALQDYETRIEKAAKALSKGIKHPICGKIYFPFNRFRGIGVYDKADIIEELFELLPNWLQFRIFSQKQKEKSIDLSLPLSHGVDIVRLARLKAIALAEQIDTERFVSLEAEIKDKHHARLILFEELVGAFREVYTKLPKEVASAPGAVVEGTVVVAAADGNIDAEAAKARARGDLNEAL